MAEFEKLIIIGGGFAGLASALAAREMNQSMEILILEKHTELLDWTSRNGLDEYPVVGSKPIPSRLQNSALRDRLFHSLDVNRIIQCLNQAGIKTIGRGESVLCVNLPEIRGRLLKLLQQKQISLHSAYSLESLSRQPDGRYRIWSTDGISYSANRLILATGGERNHGMKIASECGARVESPIPAFVRLKLASPKLGDRMAMTQRDVRIECTKSGSSATGKMNISSRGLEGPAVSCLSAVQCHLWSQLNYRLSLLVDWNPDLTSSDIQKELDQSRMRRGKRSIAESPLFEFNERSWRSMLLSSKIEIDQPWSRIRPKRLQALANRLKADNISISGMGLPACERAYAGGVSIESVNQQTFESRTSPGLYYAGEILDLHGLPGGDHQNLIWATSLAAGRSAAS